MSELACMPRSRGRLLADVEQLNPETNPEYQPRDLDGKPGDETCCNWFLADVCEKGGVPMPGSKKTGRVKAREQIAWLKSYEGLKAGWKKCDAKTAKDFAEVGKYAAATYVNPDPARSSHVALVVPALDAAGVWIAQAGRSCFNSRPLEKGFGNKPVEFFCHE